MISEKLADTTVDEDAYKSTMILSHIDQQTEEYMRELLEAGFSVQSVLEHALTDSKVHGVAAAKAIRKAAKNLHIDAESQLREARMASQELRERMRL